MIKDKVLKFMAEYTDKVNEIQERITAGTERVKTLKMEIEYIKGKELPEAVERRVMTGDSSHENKLRKSLEKVEKEYQQLQEEIIVLQNVLQRYKVTAADEATKLESLFRDEYQLQEQKCYSRLMNVKYEYVQAMIKEGEALRELKDVDVMLQQIQYNAGRRNGVYTNLDVKTAPIPNHKDRFNNVYLQLSLDEIKRLVAGTYKPDELEYLKKFANKKDL
ncbi:hypothetical protein [Priestia abyssalis]|uniref:hypothetical protein n=1 Tax=Priestia abyssalis TaxID=1221450 RepID=UPI00099596F7|nr:hypothetical protein [Priestia abyssalis]